MKNPSSSNPFSATPSSPLYVIGHKNPDTDAICAALGYADLLQKKGNSKATAARCGKVPARTEWVLKQAGIAKPALLDDVYASAEMICRKDVVMVDENATFLTAYRKMLEARVKCIPIVTASGELLGLLKYLDLLQLLMPATTDAESVRRLSASTDCVAATLEAESLAADLDKEEQKMVLLVGASSVDTVNDRLDLAEKEGDSGDYVVICGDRPIIQQIAIERKVRALIVTGGFNVSGELLAQAKQSGVVVLRCKQDTATTSKLVRCSRKVHHAMASDILKIKADDNIKDLRERLAHERQDLFPVINPADGSLIGVFSKSDLIEPKRIKLVLVDHNEYSQAVDGVDEAEVIEVIDHHRLAGDLISSEPIRYINEPVGSTSTLVAREFRYAGIELSKGIALCLIAGMVSDTLNLSSPTTSDLDRELLPWLCGIAGVDAHKFTLDFFNSGSLLAHNTAREAIGADRKVFEENDARVSISHIEECDMELFKQRQQEITSTLDALVKEKAYDLAVVIVTNVTNHHSVLVACGNKKMIESLPFDRDPDGCFQCPGVVSRKKQVFPAVCQAIRAAKLR